MSNSAKRLYTVESIEVVVRNHIISYHIIYFASVDPYRIT